MPLPMPLPMFVPQPMPMPMPTPISLIARLRRLLSRLAAAALLPLAAAAQPTGSATAQPAHSAACPPLAAAPTPAAMQAAVRQAQDRGPLWRLQKDGRVAWLYGTLHVGRLDWAPPGPTVRAALAASNTVALELDVLDPAVRARLQWPADLPMPRLDAPLGERVARQVAAACLPPGALDGQHPVMQVMTLAVLAARWEGLDAGYGQEVVLAGFAGSTGKRVVSLETPELQRDALMPRDEAETRRLAADMLTQLESGALRRSAARLAQAWAQADLAALEDYPRWCECITTEADRAWIKRLNDDRNPLLAERIAALHAEGRQVFAAVGALHMTGPQALTKLLAERGFTVERVR